MPPKCWIEKPLPDAALVQKLETELGLSPEMATILAQRGITSFDDAKHFFRPSLADLHDPFLMADMDKAVSRLEEAIFKGEKILIYGDYDVDGTTAVATVYGFLNQNVYQNIECYIPDRYKEGYGVQIQGIEYARENGFTLIICLDCGVKSVELVALAKSYGTDFIICDHHRPGEILPPAIAVLDPKREDCSYPFDELTGCGIGYKLLEAFCQKQGISEDLLLPYLDMLVCSIASDIVPIVGENRILAHFGLKQLSENPRTGLKALMSVAGLAGTMDIGKVVFGLGPRINAAGRIKHAYDAVNLMLSNDEMEAMDFAKTINTHNADRKEFDSGITQEALEMIENEGFTDAKSTVLFKPTWHKGVIGIVASRCIEQYHRPTVILTESNGKAAGSARSVPGFDLYEALEECTEHLIQFGGHTFAAGMTLEMEKIVDFRNKFEEVVAKKIKPEQLSPLIDVDLKLNLNQITEKFQRILSQMEPFGPKNMSPNFVTDNVWVQGNPFRMKEKHLKINLYQEGSPVFVAVGFGMAEEFYEALLTPRPISICYQIEVNEWQGKRSLQLMLKDIKF